jgi:hypothetical protein
LTERSLSHGKGGAKTSFLPGNYGSFEHLHALFFAFSDFDVNPDCVSHLEAGVVGAQLAVFDITQGMHQQFRNIGSQVEFRFQQMSVILRQATVF